MKQNNYSTIIDLGSSFYENDKNNFFSSYIQSRWYRSPETVDKTTITKKIDIWSFGCIIYEIYYSKPLFPANTENKFEFPPPIGNEVKLFLKICSNPKNFKIPKLTDG